MMKHLSGKIAILLVILLFISPISYNSANSTTITVDQSGHGKVIAVDWTPDGKVLAYGSLYAGIGIVNRSGNPEYYGLRNQIGFIVAVDWNHNGTLLASAATDLSIIVWKVVEQQEVTEFIADSKNITSVSFNSDGTMLASGGSDGVKLWNPNNGTELVSRKIGMVMDVEFHPTNSLVLYVTGNTSILWNADTLAVEHEMPDHMANITAAKWNANGSLFATSSYDGMIKIWREDGSLVDSLEHSDAVIDFSWNPDSSRLVSATTAGHLNIWNTITNTQIFLYDYSNETEVGVPNAVSWNSLGNQIAIGCNFDNIWELDVDDDMDGLLTSEELDLGTDPFNDDTDGDWLKDGLEVELGYSPITTDSDSDGIPDDEEYYNPTNETETTPTTTNSQAAEYTSLLLGSFIVFVLLRRKQPDKL